MAEDDQVCFYKRLFSNPVKPLRCTTEPVRPLDGINKDAIHAICDITGAVKKVAQNPAGLAS